jgi:integrase
MLAPRTRSNYCAYLLRFGAFQAQHPGSSVADQVGCWLPTLPVSSQCTARSALRWAYPDAVDWRAVKVAPYARDEARLFEGVLRDGHRRRLRAVATEPRDRALVELLWVCRRAEVTTLRWADVDLGAGTVLIRHGKGRKSAPALLPPEAQQALAQWFVAAQTPPDEALLFPSRTGRPYNPETIGRRVQRLLTAAGLWRRGLGSAHRLRRSFASAYLRDNPKDLVGLKRLLRHAKITTTEGYVFLESDDLAARLARVRL